jgi:hypothetical protein
MERMRILFALVAAAGLLGAADLTVGKPLTLKQPITVGDLMSKPDTYAGKTVQVKGKVTAVEFPKDCVGKTAVAEGKFVKTDMTREEAIAEAKEHAKDSGKPFDESKVKAGASYSIEGTGAVILM